MRLAAHGLLNDLLDYGDGRDGRRLDRVGHNGELVGEWAKTPRGQQTADALEIGLAFIEARDALPEGYALMLRGSANWAQRGAVWVVSAYHSDGRRKGWNTEGKTPQAALNALTAKLTEASGI